MASRADMLHRCGQAAVTAAADGSHTQGCMIALMPTPEDAARLAVPGGEPAEELHCTLYYLGDTADGWSEDQRNELENLVRSRAEQVPPVQANLFGAAHWNAGGDSPSWVWSVGDNPDAGPADSSLEEARWLATDALESTHERPDFPRQHSPWVAHICAAYSDDPAFLPQLEDRLGPVTFDRVRLSFGDDDRDIPLSATAVNLTAGAAGPLRREPTTLELAAHVDFSSVHAEWEAATARALTVLKSATAAWRLDLRKQITTDLADGDIDALLKLSLNGQEAAPALLGLMEEFAIKAGRACQREAEAQGVRVPDWSLPDDGDAVVAALAGRRLLASIAELTSDLMSGALLTAAKRKLSGLLRSSRPAEQIAADVDRELGSIDVGPAAGAAMTAAQNAGRHAVMSAAPPASSYVASEILDSRTCGPCKAIDGRTFTALDDAVAEYPVMGYRDCTGARYGNSCRGFIVAVWQEVRDPATTASAVTKPAAQDAAEGDQVMTTEAATEATDTEEKENECPPGMEPGPDGECVKTKEHAAGAAQALAHGAAADADMVEGKPLDAMGGGQTAPWRGPLTVEGLETGDGREFKADALTWADLPLPLRWNKEDSHGGEPHTVAVNVGRIDKVWREDGGLIMGEGVLDLSTEDGRTVHGKVKGQFLRGVSVDVDSIKDADMELVWPADPDADGEGPDPFDMLFASPEKVVFNRGRIRAATLVDIPAFAEAYIALLDEDGAVVAGGEPIGAVRETRVSRTRTTTVAAPVRPPAGWFADPNLSVPTGITVTPEGRVYGHAALWGTCHIGQEGVCVTPPREDVHPYFMTGNVWTEDGASVQVGQITVGTGHAPLSYGYRAASDHYDNTGAAVADVAVGNDGHGIWVAGSIRPGTDELRIRELRAAGQVSGDWRRIGGSLRLVGLLAVNVPGFPVPKLKTRTALGQQLALVAAGIPQLHDGLTEAELDQWAFRRVIQSLSHQVHGKE